MPEQDERVAPAGDAPASVPAVRPSTPPTVRLPVAVLAVLLAVAVALVAVWGTTAVQADGLPTGPPRDPPSAPARAATFELLNDRDVGYGEFRATMPGEPYRSCRNLTGYAPSPDFEGFVLCSASVHKNWDGKGANSESIVGAALLSTTAAGDDLEGLAKTAFVALGTSFYSATIDLKVVDRRTGESTIPAPPGSTLVYTARINLYEKQLPTRYDAVTIVLATLANGRTALYYSFVPDDASAAITDAAAASLATVTAQR